MSEGITCPVCRGRGTSEALLCGINRDGHRVSEARTLLCSACAGTGIVTDRKAALIATGQKLRDYRVHVLQRSGREEAKRLGLDPIRLNREEHGRCCAKCPLVAVCRECLYTPEEAELWAREKGRLSDGSA